MEQLAFQYISQFIFDKYVIQFLIQQPTVIANFYQNALLEHIKNVPEWQSALIYEQLAALNKAAADISTGTSTLEQGFADGKLRPDRYYCSDRVFRRDCNTGVLDSIASALGRALAALEVLSALSDAFQREYLSSVEISQGIYYNELEKLCLKHGYTKEDNT